MKRISKFGGPLVFLIFIRKLKKQKKLNMKKISNNMMQYIENWIMMNQKYMIKLNYLIKIFKKKFMYVKIIIGLILIRKY